MIKGNLPYRTMLIASGTLVIGWGIGFLTSAARTEGNHGRPGARPSSRQTEPGDYSRLVEGRDSAADTAGSTANFSPVNSSSEPGAQFESLMRGAMRITDHTDRALRLREISRWISPANLPDAVEKARRLPFSDRWQVMQALGARWAEVDPVGAAEFATKQGGNRYGWNDLLNGVIDKWASIDQQAAVAWIGKQAEGRRLNLLQSMVQSVARRDPEAALEILQSQPGSSQMNWLHQQVFEQWSQRDPAGAAKVAEGMEIGHTRERALSSVAGSWAAQDPQAAIKWAQSFEDKGTQNKILRNVAQTWAENEPQAVIQWAATLTEANVRMDVLGAAISRLAQSDFGAAQAHLSGLPSGQERDNLVQQVANATANQDVRVAMALLDLLPKGQARTSTTANLAMRLAASDPKAAGEIFLGLPPAQLSYQVDQFVSNMAGGNLEFAREWIEQIPDERMKAQATRAIGAVMARGDPRAAAEWMMQKQPGSDLTWVLNQWVRNAPKDVMAWAKELPDGEARRSAEASVVQSLVWIDVEQARTIFSKDLSPEAQVSTANNIASQWANRDLAAARAWAEALPAGGARENALSGIVRSWATQDAGAATQWLERFSAGDERDRVVTQFAGAVVQRDPEGALAWAASITDPDLRGAQLEQLAGRWLQMDGAAAREWIQGSDHLTPSARRRIIEQRTPNYGPSMHMNFFE